MSEFQINDRVKPNEKLKSSKRVPSNKTYKISETRKAMNCQIIQLEGFGDFYFSKYFDLVLRGVSNVQGKV